MLKNEGAAVAFDAMCCQREIAKKITENKWKIS
jgi:predicted transposase YbfD/YdcC